MANPTPVQSDLFNLKIHSPLNGHSTMVDGASLEEIINLSMVSVSPFKSEELAFQNTIRKLFDSGAPSATKVLERTKKKACIFLPTAHGQWFLCFENDGADPIDTASNLLGKGISNRLAMTDQSDSWVVLALAGSLVHQTLERICPIDCSASAMPIGTAARTIIEHLGAIILRRPDDGDNTCFWLLSPRSSATSFLRAVTASPPFNT